ncbi:MAG: hypothetical protein QM662_05365 [Gordonia sp. (in: high G+C Gram-positive bacteria)]
MAQLITRVVLTARRRKEESAAAGEQRHGLLAVRDGTPLAWVDHTEVNALLGAADVVASGYGADALAVVLEAVLPLVETNPLTGENWRPGEADDVWREHDGAERGWVSECLVIELMTRAGERVAVSQPFRVTGDGIDWADDVLGIGGTGLADVLAGALSRPAVDPATVPDPGEHFVAPEGAPHLPPDRGRIALDVGLTRVLDRQLTVEKPGGGARYIVADEAAAERYRAEGLMAHQLLIGG